MRPPVREMSPSSRDEDGVASRNISMVRPVERPMDRESVFSAPRRTFGPTREDQRDERVSPTQIRTIKEQVSKNLSDSERVYAKWKFKAKRPTKTGATLYAQIGDFLQVGDDWKQRIIESIAKTKGPGEYEGYCHTHDGKPIPEEAPWHLEISEEEAASAGWNPNAQEDNVVSQSLALTGSVASTGASGQPAPTKPEDILEEELAAKREKARIELLKHRVEATKIEKELQKVQNSDGPPDEKKGMSDEAVKRVIEAEKATAEANHKARLAEIEANNKAERLRLETEHAKAIAGMKSDMDTDRRKAEDALRALADAHKTQMSSIEQAFENKMKELSNKFEATKRETTIDDIQRTFSDKLSKTEERLAEAVKKIAEEKVRPEEHKARPEEYAAAISNAFAPLLNGIGGILGPIATALIAKANQPPPEPPKAPDPIKQFEAMAGAIEKMIPKQAEQPRVDPMEQVTRTLDLVKTVIPQQPPPPAAADIATAVANALAPHMPKRRDERERDPLEFAGQVMSMAQQFSSMRGSQVEHASRPDVLEQIADAKEKLESIGIPVHIGGGVFEKDEEPAQQNMVRDIFDGVKDIMPAVGETVAKYVNSKKPDFDPELIREFQLEQLKKRQATMRRRQQAGMRPAPVQGQQAPQPLPQQQRPQAVQPRPQQRALPPQAPQQRQQAPVPQQRQQTPAPQQRAPQPQQPAQHAAQLQTGAPQQQRQAQAQTQAQAAQQPRPQNRFVPKTYEQEEYGLPTVVIPRRPQVKSPEGPKEPVPQRAAAPKPPEVVDHIPVRVSGDSQQAQEFVEELDAKGMPTNRTWGELSNYAVTAMGRGDDPESVAITFLEKFPKAAELVMKIGSTGIDNLDSILTSLATEAGPYATTVGQLASAIRSDPGRPWATRLIQTLTGSTIAEPA